MNIHGAQPSLLVRRDDWNAIASVEHAIVSLRHVRARLLERLFDTVHYALHILEVLVAFFGTMQRLLADAWVVLLPYEGNHVAVFVFFHYIYTESLLHLVVIKVVISGDR